MPQKLPSYLRTCRKRSGLTQDELAFLLGCRSGAKVSRYERLSRRPNLETAFACQAIFGVSAHELLPGIFAGVEQELMRRSRLLSQRLSTAPAGPRAHRKLKLLGDIGSRDSGTP